jgi:hypothetical protein
LKATGNTEEADGFGYPAVGDRLSTAKLCTVIDSKFEGPGKFPGFFVQVFVF